jgi:tetratricopeptide (TPR) repeat protein
MMVVDNADDAETIFSQYSAHGIIQTGVRLSDFLPQSPHGSLLITSRSRDVAYRLTGRYASIIDVKPMSDHQALDLFRNKSDSHLSQVEEQDAIKLVQTLDCVPLAITQAATYLAQRGSRITISQFLQKIKRNDHTLARFLQKDSGNLRRDYLASNSVMTTLQISFEHIQKHRPMASNLLSLMSLFDSQMIPESVLHNWYMKEDTGEADFEDDLSTLVGYSFIEQSPDGNHFEMYRLVQFSTKKWLEINEELEQWIGKYATLLDDHFPAVRHENWKICQTLLPHVQAAVKCRPKDLKALKAWASALFKAAWYAREVGSYNIANIMDTSALEAREAILGAEHPDTLNSMESLGLVLSRQGKYEDAEGMHRRVLQIRKKLLGAEHPDTLDSMSNLGLTLLRQGKYEEAEKIHRKDVEGSERVLGVEHPNTLTSINNLGLVLERQGKYEEAQLMHKRALEQREWVLGPDHPDTLNSVNNLASVLQNQGGYDEAEVMHRRALKGYRELHGHDHPDILMSIDGVGSVLQKQGKLEEAEAMHRQAIKGYEETLGLEHPCTLNSVSNLGSVLESQGKYEEAERTHRRVLETRRKVLGPDHPDTLSSISQLGSVSEKKGKYEEAEVMHLRAQKGYEKILGPVHPDTLSSICQLGLALEGQGKHEEAEKTHRRGLEGRLKVLGPEHPDTLSSLSSLGLVLQSQGKYEESEEMHRRVLEAREKVLGPDHPHTLNSMSLLGWVLESQGRYDESKEMHRRAKEGYEKVIGPRLPDTLASMANLSTTYRNNTVCDNFDENSDSISDISDVASVFSSSSSVDSFSSTGSYEDARQTAAQHLAFVLSKHPLLQPLYSQGVRELEKNRFSKNHDRLLKKFLADLRLESRDNIHLQAIRFFQNRSQREVITSQIFEFCQEHLNDTTKRSMQQYLDQKVDQAYRLDRFLGSWSEKTKPTMRETAAEIGNSSGSNEVKKIEYEVEDEIENEIEDYEEDSEEDEEELDDEIEQDQTTRFPHLDSVVAFLIEGPPFQNFKTSLSCLINPPTTINEAVEYRDIRGLRQLLKRRFDDVTQGEYSWIRELDETGYTRNEIAELLFEQTGDTPWIYFESTTFEPLDLQTSLHLPGCVHQFFSPEQRPLDQTVTTTFQNSTFPNWQSVIESVQELCGLAGITPISRNLKNWNGSVMFEEQNAVAIVTYSQLSDISTDQDHCTIISRIINALKRFCLAVGIVQTTGLCCDSFTILKMVTHSFDQQAQPELLVEVCRVDFKIVLQMLSELQSLFVLRNIGPADTPVIQGIALRLLQPFMQGTAGMISDNGVNATLQYCAQAVQLLCLGFLSYSQAHVGTLRPFFLDTPLKEVQLHGIQTPKGEYDWIKASLNNLTCIGDMIKGPVLTFNLVQSRKLAQSTVEPPSYNLLTNALDLLDTWGPGEFIVHEGPGNSPSAIRIGDGIVFASDSENNRFHWSQRMLPQDIPRGTLDPETKILIGTLITVNINCRINENQCWTKSTPCLEPLGPQGAHWEHDERQLGVQAGNYVVFQAVTASHKLPAQTLKQHRLRQDDETLIPFLDNLWGVQVSFCTRIARRVPLREMIVDMLPIFAVAFGSSQDERNSWEELKTTHDIIGAFQRQGLREWLITLSPKLHQYVLRIIRRIFNVLQHTGLDRDGKYLLIAWLREHDTFRCLKVPCENESSWAGILADSEDCATFAYISTKCLETEKIKCSGPEPVWQNVILLLETAVVLHSIGPVTLTHTLQHNRTYFFQKLDDLFLVRVQKSDTAGTANLVPTRSIIPPEVQRRMFAKWRRLARLREKIAFDDLAEQVAVSQ